MEHREKVEVRNEFDGTWASGFEVVERVPADAAEGERYSYRLCRSDGTEIPSPIAGERVRPAES